MNPLVGALLPCDVVIGKLEDQSTKYSKARLDHVHEYKHEHAKHNCFDDT